MKRPLKSRWLPPLVAISLLAISACGGSSGSSSTTDSSGWASVVQKANAEGSVSWWSGATTEPNHLVVEAFRKAYPNIAIDLQQGTPSQLIPRFDQVQQNNLTSPDVFTNYDLVWVADQKSKGVL